MSNESNDTLLEKLIAARNLLDESIESLSGGKRGGPRAAAKPAKKRFVNLDYSRNLRYFIKSNSPGLNGPKKFVLLLAYLSKGKENTEISLEEIKRKWATVTAKGLMGYDFNTNYSTTAKTEGWVDSKQPGIYTLTKNWLKIFD